MPTLNDARSECLSCTQYIQSMKPLYRGGFARQAQEYKLDKKVVEKLRIHAKDYVLVAVFGDWCSDAAKAIPVLSLLEREIGISVRALGGMEKPPYGSPKFWAVPPSPKEVEVFDITSSPTIIIFRKSGEEVGRIKTKPKMTPTIEAEILKIIEDSRRA